MAEALLSAVDLTRRFGGLTAVSAVSLALRQGELHAVIGTNGAGKLTLINMLSGEMAATSGRIELAGADITAWSQPRRAHAGIGRSYQRTTIFPSLSVFENTRLCAQASEPRPWQLWQRAATCPTSGGAAARALAAAGLEDVAARPAGLLSHGQQRQLEIAMCLATDPRVLLLDGDGQRRGDRERCAGAHPHEPGSASRLPRRRPLTVMLKITDLNTYYGDSHMLRGVDFRVRAQGAAPCSAATAWARRRCSAR